MFLVGLTGGIGSGKSTVARRLVERGVEVIDADAIAREVVEPDGPALPGLVARFGPSILLDDGRLDRRALARVAFADEHARADLDRLTHPHIAARIAARITELAGRPEARPGDLVIVDHPLLIETGQTGRFDAVVVVIADEALRTRRLRDQRGLGEDDISARIAAQTDDATRRALATEIIENDGSLEQLLDRTDEVHERLRATARASTRRE